MEYWTGMKFSDLPLTLLFVTATLMSIGSAGPVIFYAYSQKEIYKNWVSRLTYLPVLIMIGTGISIVNAKAWVEAIMGIPSGFKRTPKLRIEKNGDTLKDKMKYHQPLDLHSILEFAMGIYCLFCIYISFVVGKPFMVGFLIIYSSGFFFVGWNTVKEYLWKFQANLEPEAQTSAEIA